jgi:hypothetical protein
MIPAHHRKCRVAFKCSLTVINLVFVTAQVSCIFYLFASYLVYCRASRMTAIHAGGARSDTVFLHYPEETMSIDKRYRANTIFIPEAPTAGSGVAGIAVIRQYLLCVSRMEDVVIKIPPLRGPPAGTSDDQRGDRQDLAPYFGHDLLFSHL